MPARLPGRRGFEAAAVVGDPQQRAAAVPGQCDADVRRPGVAQRVVQGFLGDPQQRLLLGGGQSPYAQALEGDPGRVGPVQDLDLGPEGGDEAVLVERGGAQLDDGGAQFVDGFRRECGDLLELPLARAGSRSTRVAAAWAVSRSEKSFWLTASCSSWASRERSSAMVSSRLRS